MTFKLLVSGEIIESESPGKYAAHKKLKIFGKLDCWSGTKFMSKKNRIFFSDMRSAILQGFRPCKNCKPMIEIDFISNSDIIPNKSLDQFYNRDQ